MIATGLSVYGKVGEAQNKTMAANLLGKEEKPAESKEEKTAAQRHKNVVDSVIEEFDNTTDRR